MIKVKDLIEKINFLLKNDYISDDDIVIIAGTGDKKSGYLNDIVMPKIKFKKSVNDNKKGFLSLGFSDIEDIII